MICPAFRNSMNGNGRHAPRCGTFLQVNERIILPYVTEPWRSSAQMHYAAHAHVMTFLYLEEYTIAIQAERGPTRPCLFLSSVTSFGFSKDRATIKCFQASEMENQRRLSVPEEYRGLRRWKLHNQASRFLSRSGWPRLCQDGSITFSQLRSTLRHFPTACKVLTANSISFAVAGVCETRDYGRKKQKVHLPARRGCHTWS